MAQVATIEIGSRPWRLPSLSSSIALAIAVATFIAVSVAASVAALDREPADAVPALGIVGFAAVGAIVVGKRPRNSTGWVLLLAGLSIALMSASLEYAHRSLDLHAGHMPGGELAAWVSTWFPLVTAGLLLGVLPQIYPDGRLISRRWRWTLAAGFIFMFLAVLGNAFEPEQVEGLANETNPYAVASLKPFFDACIIVSLPALVLAVLGGVSSIIVRWRRSQGDERQQIMWFIVGVTPAALGALVLHNINATPPMCS